jgi:RNA polymerase sigma factor for flagellar operon FliA
MKHATLWALYTETGDRTARDTLVSEHLGLVHHIARKMGRSLVSGTELSELVGFGSLGLLNAVDTFDPTRGIAFSTFAAPRIRGAILDELRRHDPASRSLRRKAREIRAAQEALVQRLGTAPTDAQLAERLGVDLDTLWRWQAEVASTHCVPIDRPQPEADRREPLAASVPDVTGEQIEEELNVREEVAVLREAIGRLKGQEQMVLALYYFEDLTQDQIAAVLGITGSRVSQIHSRAVAKLRSRMSALRAP